MKILHTILLTAISLFPFVQQNILAQGCNHPHNRTQNLLMPDIKFGITTGNIPNNCAFSLLGEAGRRNFRFSGTYGALLENGDRIKGTGEYLQQKLGYQFSDSKEHRWVRQYAGGIAYYHDFNDPVF